MPEPQDERWRIAELAHSCGYCNGAGMTERCDIDGPDLRAADRLAPLLTAARRKGAEQALRDAADGLEGNPRFRIWLVQRADKIAKGGDE